MSGKHGWSARKCSVANGRWRSQPLFRSCHNRHLLRRCDLYRKWLACRVLMELARFHCLVYAGVSQATRYFEGCMATRILERNSCADDEVRRGRRRKASIAILCGKAEVLKLAYMRHCCCPCCFYPCSAGVSLPPVTVCEKTLVVTSLIVHGVSAEVKIQAKIMRS